MQLLRSGIVDHTVPTAYWQPFVCRLDRDFGFYRIIVRMYASVLGIEQARPSQRLDIRVHVAVVALQRLRKGANAGDIVPADVTQQLHPFTGQDTGECVPALES